MKDRHPIIIIGAHRSGTSATARALELVGLQIGQDLDSHREPRALQKLHEDYLERVGAAWHKPEPFLKSIWLRLRISFGAAWGWKEPRTTLFAPAWLEIFPEGRIVHVVRDSLAAAESIRERELKFQAAGDPPTGNLSDLDYSRRLVEIYLKAAERVARSPNYYRFHFEELQANPPAMLEQLAKFCGLPIVTRKLAAAAASIRPSRGRSTSS